MNPVDNILGNNEQRMLKQLEHNLISIINNSRTKDEAMDNLLYEEESFELPKGHPVKNTQYYKIGKNLLKNAEQQIKMKFRR